MTVFNFLMSTNCVVDKYQDYNTIVVVIVQLDWLNIQYWLWFNHHHPSVILYTGCLPETIFFPIMNL